MIRSNFYTNVLQPPAGQLVNRPPLGENGRSAFAASRIPAHRKRDRLIELFRQWNADTARRTCSCSFIDYLAAHTDA